MIPAEASDRRAGERFPGSQGLLLGGQDRLVREEQPAQFILAGEQSRGPLVGTSELFVVDESFAYEADLDLVLTHLPDLPILKLRHLPRRFRRRLLLHGGQCITPPAPMSIESIDLQHLRPGWFNRRQASSRSTLTWVPAGQWVAGGISTKPSASASELRRCEAWAPADVTLPST